MSLLLLLYHICIYIGGAQSLTDIGFTEWAKTQTKHTNYKGLAIAGWGGPDYMKYTLVCN